MRNFLHLKMLVNEKQHGRKGEQSLRTALMTFGFGSHTSGSKKLILG